MALALDCVANFAPFLCKTLNTIDLVKFAESLGCVANGKLVTSTPKRSLKRSRPIDADDADASEKPKRSRKQLRFDSLPRKDDSSARKDLPESAGRSEMSKFATLVSAVLQVQKAPSTMTKLADFVMVDADRTGQFGLKARRRTYDVVNVLCGLGMAEKTGNKIRWSGPSKAEPQRRLLEDRVREKKAHLHDLRRQESQLLWLCERNRGAPAPLEDRLHPPFVLVATAGSANVEMAPDRKDIFMNFTESFELIGDVELLDQVTRMND